MGCSQSSTAAAAAAASAAAASGKPVESQKPATTPTPTNSQEGRAQGTIIDALGKTVDVTLGNHKKVQISSLTRQNYYPPPKTKPNQDACASYQFTAKDGSIMHVFAVLDGHGEDGHKIAQWVSENLPKQIELECQKIDTSEEGPVSMDASDVETACRTAHLVCNKALVQQKAKMEIQWSGTTCCCIVVWAGGITICNVGDSRVIMGEFVTKNNNNNNSSSSSSSNKTPPATTTVFAAKALSHDHIPLRKDERDRIKKTGARVITIGQAAGKEEINEEEDDQKWTTTTNSDKQDEERIYTENPPRVFAPGEMYPGYQFTRSFGDYAGAKLGIIAEPEMSTIRFLSTIGLLVLATDGVYEYLTDQDVVDVCALFANPKDACEAVIELAYKNWIDKDVRTDDITMTCMYINRENFDPLSLSMSVRNGTRIVNEPSHDEKSGLPNFSNLTVDCIKECIKTGKITNTDFARVGLRSNESFLFGEDDIAALQKDNKEEDAGSPPGPGAVIANSDDAPPVF